MPEAGSRGKPTWTGRRWELQGVSLWSYTVNRHLKNSLELERGTAVSVGKGTSYCEGQTHVAGPSLVNRGGWKHDVFHSFGVISENELCPKSTVKGEETGGESCLAELTLAGRVGLWDQPFSALALLLVFGAG